MQHFKQLLSASKNVVCLTGAGISAESGIPTFRGEGGLWRQFNATELATPRAFNRDPSLVWEFYHYRRELVLTKEPNAGHFALVNFEKQWVSDPSRKFTLITQNVDGLHFKAGSQNVIEMHGSLWRTKCFKCEDVAENLDSPICEALDGFGAPDIGAPGANIPAESLPRCKKDHCGGLLRPAVVWFEEALDQDILDRIFYVLENECDLLMVVGTSGVVYPAAGFATTVKHRGGKVVEFNIEKTTADAHLSILGKSGEMLPEALNFM
ncbi:putative Sirtuin 5 [Cladochytrium replicatum]|nr:putative Sirtuin 5 [Cladochytrium replicatum]